MAERLDLTCLTCGYVGLDDGADGFFYCQRCGSQAEDLRDTAVGEDDFFENLENGLVHKSGQRRRIATGPVTVAEPISQFLSQTQSQSQFWDSLKSEDDDAAGDGVGPTGPGDFATGSRTVSYDDYYSEIRLRYVMGVQIMIQLQCKALVEQFKVNPLIVGLAGTIWLRFVALKRVFADEWADQAIHESESQKQGEADDVESTAKRSAEPLNIFGQRAVMIWYRSLSKTIPLSYSLVISFLACHVSREPILPTDILKWALEGKLPYFAAFVEIEKQIGPPSRACPFSSSSMFRPSQVIPSQKLESLAASVAQTIGLALPPVNFYAIASRYLSWLSLPVGKILPQACRLFEWSMPAKLWLSANEFRLPTRVCVMSILIVTIRMIYNINGFGIWEKSLSTSSGLSSLADQNHETKPMCNTDMDDDDKQGTPSHDLDDSSKGPSGTPSDVQQSELDCVKLLKKLEAEYDGLVDTYEYSKDLPTYLQYCKDVVFAGLGPSFEDREEENIIDELWDFYQKRKGSEESNDQGVGSLGCSSGLQHKRSRDEVKSISKESKKFRDSCSASNTSEDGGTSENNFSQHTMNWEHYSPKDEDSLLADQPSTESHKDRAIRLLKSNMEENRFFYIPPRVNIKRSDYIQYSRKKDEGAYTYAAHADYYILLRSCSRVAQVDVRSMHFGVLCFERRLAWLEKRIDYCLHLKSPTDSCEFCQDEMEEKATDDNMDFSKISL